MKNKKFANFYNLDEEKVFDEKISEEEEEQNLDINSNMRVGNPRKLMNCVCLIVISLISLLLISFIYPFHTEKTMKNDFPTISDLGVLIKKPLTDHSNYSFFRTNNNIDSLLIYSPDSKKCSISLAVDSGGFNDKEIKGLAHFCEHMLFLGSKKFPDQTFDDLLSKSNGYSNAYTSETKTVYFFQNECSKFENLLERFSRFFIDPLFSLEFVLKEINAINSEFENNFNEDNYKFFAILRNFSSNKSVLFDYFGTGNAETLTKGISAERLVSELQEYFKKYYFSENMKIVISSDQPFEKSVKWLSLFDEVKKGEFEKNQNNEKIFPSENLRKIIAMESYSESIGLSFVFTLPEQLTIFNYKILEFIEYVTTSKNPNTLFSILKAKFFIVDLNIELLYYEKEFSVIRIKLSLTRKGIENCELIIRMLYDYLEKIKMINIKEIYEDLKSINYIKFKYLAKKNSLSEFVSKLSEDMFNYNYEDLLEYNYVFEYNEEIINNHLNMLTPINSLIFLQTNNLSQISYLNKYFEKNESFIEKIYKTKYYIGEFSENEFHPTSDNPYEFGLKFKNRFISSINLGAFSPEFNEKSNITATIKPVKLNLSDEIFSFYYFYDNSFQIPKVRINIKIYFEKIFQLKIDEYISTLIFQTIFRSKLNDILHNAQISGNIFSINSDDNNIILNFECFTDICQNMIESIGEIFETKIEFEEFEYYKEITMQTLKNKNNQQLILKSFEIFSNIQRNKNYLNYSDINPEFDLQYETFKIINYKNISKFSLLILGFISNQESENICFNIKSKLSNYLSNKKLILEKTLFGFNRPIIINKVNDHKSDLNHCILNSYQMGLSNYKLLAISRIMILAFGNIFYDTLRTSKQLGYMVYGFFKVNDGSLYYHVFVKGTKNKPELMNYEIENTFELLRNKIEILDSKQFEDIREQTLKNQIKNWKNIEEMSEIPWGRIKVEENNFDLEDQIKEELKSIKIEELKYYFKKNFFEKPKIISIRIHSKEHGNKNMTIRNNDDS